MQELYFVLAAVHLIAVVITGFLWTVIDLSPGSKLRSSLRDIRAVHFGSLYLISMFLGLAYAFDRLKVPAWHQLFFPAGLGALVFFSGLGYLFPLPPGVAPFYYWTRGWPKVLALIGIVALAFSLIWTAAVIVYYAAAR